MINSLKFTITTNDSIKKIYPYTNEFLRSVTGDEKNKSDSELVGMLETEGIIEWTTNQLPVKENLVSPHAFREYLR